MHCYGEQRESWLFPARAEGTGLGPKLTSLGRREPKVCTHKFATETVQRANAKAKDLPGPCQNLSTAKSAKAMTLPRDVSHVFKSPFKTILNYRDVGLTINSLQAKV